MRYTREDGCRAWLASASPDPEIMLKLLRQYGSAEAIYDVFHNTDALAFSEHFSPKVISELRASAQRDSMRALLMKMRDAEMSIMSHDDSIYPEALRNISDPPPFLFYMGDPACLSAKCIAIVGSRSASPESVEMTYRIAYDLARRGITIVSGLAVGIDAAAHRGCLAAGGRTVGLCACGLDVPYPSEHDALKQEILQKGGVLLSEFPPGDPALPWHFRVRNRIISGLSSAVVMMECRIRSGSMTTVQHALNQGREVFAFPGQSGTAWAEGAHQLLREGANYFSSAEDIINDLGWQKCVSRPLTKPQQSRPPQQNAPPPESTLPLSEGQKQIIAALGSGTQSFDQLAVITGMATSALSGELTMLQLYGLVQPLPGKQYMIKPKLER